MKKWLNKEYIIKRKISTLLVEVLLDAMLATLILYYCLTDFNSFIVEIFTFVSDNNVALKSCLVLFPAILIVVAICFAAYYVTVGKLTEGKTKNK